MGILDEIVTHKRSEVSAARARRPVSDLLSACRDLPPARDFIAALRPQDLHRVRIIAEVKRASPSKGVLAGGLDPAPQARRYAKAGAAAVSVLTDQKYFQGSLDDLVAVRAAVDVPVLRKEFIVDEYQLWEARAAGADAVLLIVAILSDAELRGLLTAADAAGLDALVEVHEAEELRRALAAGAYLLGVNNRDLRSMEVRLETSLELAPLLPADVLAVAESGIRSGADVRRLRDAGYSAFLVGEHLMLSADPGAALGELIRSADAPGS
jgi:indole-3-glycerol phosphate synthase